MYDIIIIGAGPAGMTAALYAKRAKKNILLFEAKTYGGKIINTLEVENYPALPHVSGTQYATNLYEQLKELECDVNFEKVIEVKKIDNYLEVKTNKNAYESKTIIIATGSENRRLGIDNEEELIGKGISYCATCDGNFYKGKDVAVVGGGNTAIEDALYLSNIVNKVYLIHRKDTFQVDKQLIEELKQKKNIECIYNSNITKLNYDNKLTSIDITNKDADIKNLKVEGLFVAIGQVPENEKFRNLIKVDKKGYIIANEDCRTNIEGIFVAGDVRTKKLRQLVTATSDGAVAATEAIKYLNT